MKVKVQKIFKGPLKDIKQFYEKDSRALSMTIALTIAFILLTYSYITLTRPKDFVSFSILDEQKEAKNYPELLVIGENNTCRLWIVIENHMEKSITCNILLKITKQPNISIPLQMKSNTSYSATLNKGEIWEKLVEISLNETGEFHLVFELWIYSEEVKDFEFSNNFCVLNVRVREV